jgi:hypothetical protein
MGKDCFKILKFFAGLMFFFSAAGVFAAIEGSDTVNVEMKNFIKPQYDEKTHLLQYVLTGDYAKTEGAIIRVTNAKIEFIGADGKSVTAILTSPEIFYNQSTQFINGNQPIHLRSEGFDADGVGFDASQISESLHLRKDVKLNIRSFDQSSYSFAIDSKNADTQRSSDSEKAKDTAAASNSSTSNIGADK